MSEAGVVLFCALPPSISPIYVLLLHSAFIFTFAPVMEKNKNKVAFYTLGCKLNFSETSTLARVFTNNGFERVAAAEPADIYVINTCSVTEQADKKCKQAIRRFIKQSPAAVVAVTGCYAQLKPDEVAAIEGVDLVLGADAKGQLFEYVNTIREKGEARIFSCEINNVNSFFQAFSSGDRTRSFLKVQDGCDYQCSYCTIPLARGRSRNVTIAALVKEAQTIAAGGAKEIILTGVNVGDFGRTTAETFLELIKSLDTVEGIERYRISSIEPNLLTDEIVAFTAQSTKFLPHFHIPLQSGSNQVLAWMRRRYRREIFANRVGAVRELMPTAFFGVDVIVGFPGETEEHFQDTFSFLETVKPSFLHVFPYSERPNTASTKLSGKVNEQEIARRVRLLLSLSERLHADFYRQNIGRTRPVLFESARRAGKMFGFTDNYIKVERAYDASKIGQIEEVYLSGIAESGNMESVIG